MSHYFILGLESDASQEEIKEAYRRLAQKFHPDHYGPDTGPFLKIQEAYRVLIDPESYGNTTVAQRHRKYHPQSGISLLNHRCSATKKRRWNRSPCRIHSCATLHPWRKYSPGWSVILAYRRCQNRNTGKICRWRWKSDRRKPGTGGCSV